MSKGFVVTIVTILSICVICAAVYFLGVTASKQSLAICGVVDHNGKIVVPVKYEQAIYLDGDNSFVKKNDKGYIYNNKTKELKPTEYSFIIKVDNNLYYVSKDNCSGLVDKNYKVVVPIKYSMIFVDKDVIRAYRENKKGKVFCLFDLKGKKIFETTEYSFIYYKEQSIIIVKSSKEKGKYYTIDKTGKRLLALNYDRLYNIGEGFAVFKKGDKCGVVNLTTGKEIVPPIYGSINRFQNGYAVVSDKDITKMDSGVKQGVIDKNGKFVIPLSDNRIGNFSEGLLSLQKGNKAGYMNINGKEVIPLKYAYADEFSEGLASVKNNMGKIGFIDKTGKQIVPFTYKDVNPFYNGYSVVTIQNGNLFDICASAFMNKYCIEPYDGYLLKISGVIDKTGKLVVPFKYSLIFNDEIGPFSIYNYENKSDKKYFMVCKMNRFAFFGRMLGFRNPED